MPRAISAIGQHYLPLCDTIDERAIVNAIVGLLATRGSTNHTIHLVAIARAAGIAITWDDFGDLSRAVPLLARIYPNGSADVNHFHAAGGIGMLKALGGPFPDHVFCPTGGVTRANAVDYLALPNVMRRR